MKTMKILSLGLALASGLVGTDLWAQDISAMPAPPPDKARIVVMRVKQGLGKDVEAAVLRSDGGKPEFLSLLIQGEKLVFEVPSGQHEFLTLGYSKPATGGFVTGRGDLLFADLQGGKTYYVVLRYWVGGGGFIPVPVRADRKYKTASREVTEGISSYRIVREDPASKERFARERSFDRVQEEYVRAKAVYQTKSASQIGERTLHPGDSVN